MNRPRLSQHDPQKTSVKIALLVASIFLLGSGCRVPQSRPFALDSLIAPAQTVNKPLVEPVNLVKQVSMETSVEATQARTVTIDSQPSPTLQIAPSGVSASTNDGKGWNRNPMSNRGVESRLAAAEAWKLDSFSDARTDSGDFSGLLHRDRPASLIGRMWDDQKNFYSPESLTLLGGGLVVGGAMANTSFDREIQKHFQSSVRGASSDDWFNSLHSSKELGNGKYTLPIFATAWAAGELFPDNALAETSGRWGERSIRGFVVGAPPLILMQHLTGGSRPTETSETSEWHPLRDNNGISGHAFMGSLPFITAAKMTDNPGYKFLFYAGSTLAPLSRVNDNAHYPSQVALGWWMAYLAASAIDATDNPNSRWRFYPYATADGSGMMAEFRY